MVAYATAPKPDWFWGVAPEFPTDVQNATAPFRAAALQTIGRVRPPFALALGWPAREGPRPFHARPPCADEMDLRPGSGPICGSCAKKGRRCIPPPCPCRCPNAPPSGRWLPIRPLLKSPLGGPKGRLQTALMAQSEGGAGLFAALSRPRQRTRRHGKLPKAVLRLFASLPSPCLPPL